jgi:hypothetical protein
MTAAVALGRRHHEQVDAERPAGQRADLGDGRQQPVRRHIAGAQHAQAAGIADRRHQRRLGRLAGHGREHDGVIDMQSLCKGVGHVWSPWMTE